MYCVWSSFNFTHPHKNETPSTVRHAKPTHRFHSRFLLLVLASGHSLRPSSSLSAAHDQVTNMTVIAQGGLVLDDKENRLLDQAIKILELEARVASSEARVDKLEARQDKHEETVAEKLVAHAEMLEELKEKLEAHEEMMQNLDERIVASWASRRPPSSATTRSRS